MTSSPGEMIPSGGGAPYCQVTVNPSGQTMTMYIGIYVVQIVSLLMLLFFSGAIALIQSTGAQSIGSQEQVQHENAKSTQYRDQQLPYCTQREK